jgi:small subunit ribosomal protein S16
MPTRIRLQRHGKKHNAFFHIVVADGRAPRDGKFIEKIGTYNPITNPATIELDFDKAVTWMQNGAQPSETCRAILSYKGVLYKHHLLKGVVKGALTAEQVEAKVAQWLTEKTAKIDSKKNKLSSDKNEDKRKRFAAEQAVKEAIAAKVAAKNTPAVEEAPVAEAAAEAPEAPAENAEA